jgi:hypothetical protein
MASLEKSARTTVFSLPYSRRRRKWGGGSSISI